uniref:Uncharacterized protein n=1 Tax=Arundo donax TaxID=35708 RepID=A0A0A9EZ15_ARUDO
MAPAQLLPAPLSARSLLTDHLAPRPSLLRAPPPLHLPTTPSPDAVRAPPQHLRPRRTLPRLPRRSAPHAVLRLSPRRRMLPPRPPRGGLHRRCLRRS